MLECYLPKIKLLTTLLTCSAEGLADGEAPAEGVAVTPLLRERVLVPVREAVGEALALGELFQDADADTLEV